MIIPLIVELIETSIKRTFKGQIVRVTVISSTHKRTDRVDYAQRFINIIVGQALESHIHLKKKSFRWEF